MPQATITIPLQLFADLTAIAECYVGEADALKLTEDQLTEARGYIADAEAICAPHSCPEMLLIESRKLPQPARWEWESKGWRPGR